MNLNEKYYERYSVLFNLIDEAFEYYYIIKEILQYSEHSNDHKLNYSQGFLQHITEALYKELCLIAYKICVNSNNNIGTLKELHSIVGLYYKENNELQKLKKPNKFNDDTISKLRELRNHVLAHNDFSIQLPQISLTEIYDHLICCRDYLNLLYHEDIDERIVQFTEQKQKVIASYTSFWTGFFLQAAENVLSVPQ